MEITMVNAKKKLAVLWLTGSSVLFFLFFFQTLFGKYTGKAVETWGWLMPAILPSLSLVLGVWGVDIFDKGIKEKKVDKFVYRLSFALSVLYLTFVTMTIMLEPFTDVSSLEWLKLSNLWLGPFQGLVMGSLGIFFVKKN